MLEELLESNSADPAESARYLMDYMALELPIGGDDARDRFCKALFPLLVSRTFGYLDTSVSPTAVAEGEVPYRHMPGGWLSKEKKWNYYGSSSSGLGQARTVGSQQPSSFSSIRSTSMSHGSSATSTSSSITNDPVVQLLSPPPFSSAPSSSPSKISSKVVSALSHARSGHPSASSSTNKGTRPRVTLITLLCQSAPFGSGLQYAFPYKAMPPAFQQLMMKIVEKNLEHIGPAAAQMMMGNNAEFVTDSEKIAKQALHETQATSNELKLMENLMRTRPMQQASIVKLYKAYMEARRQQYQQLNMQQAQYAFPSPRGIYQNGSTMMSPPQQQSRAMMGMSSPLGMMSSARNIDPMRNNPYSPSVNWLQQQQQPGGSLQSPVPQEPPQASTEESLQRQTMDCMVMLSMREFYIMTFFRYPMAKPKVTQSSSASRSSQGRNPPAGIYGGSPYNVSSSSRYLEHYGDLIYMHLFQCYVKYLFRRAQDGPITSPTLYGQDPSSLGQMEIASDIWELFLRVLITFWMNGQNIPIKNTVLAEQKLREASQQGQFFATSPGDTQNEMFLLSSAFDSIELSSDYKFYPPLITKSLPFLIRHLCSDVALWQNVQQLQTTDPSAQNAQASLDFLVQSGDVSINNAGVLDMVLTPPLITMQQSLWNYLRVAMKYASFSTINYRTGESSFSRAVNLWLLWLEPWNNFPTPKHTSGSARDLLLSTVASAKSSSAMGTRPFVPTPTSPSKYSAVWAPYIAANVHFYGSLLAIFVRRARDLDFSFKSTGPSTGNDPFNKSLALVRLVFRVFTPEVVSVINRCLAVTERSTNDSAIGFDDSNGKTTRRSSTSDVPTIMERQWKIQHDHVLGDFGPLAGSTKLKSATVKMSTHDLAEDMYALLDEIDFQWTKHQGQMGFVDRMDDRFNTLFGQHNTKQERRSIDTLKTMGGINIAGLPNDFQLSSEQNPLSLEPRRLFTFGNKTTGDAVSADTEGKRHLPETTPDGYLTDKGREELRRGWKVFRPQDVPYLGDHMFGRVKSYEVAFLVELTVWLSMWLNIVVFHAIPESYKKNVLSKRIQRDGPAFIQFTQHKDFMKNRWRWINLRFLADRRTLIWLAAIFSFIKLVRNVS